MIATSQLGTPNTPSVMVTNDLEFRVAEREDIPSLLSHFQKFYTAHGWTKQVMQWQYFDNPAGATKIWMCFADEKPVGSLAAVPHVVWAHDRTAVGYRIQDTVTDPDYRGRRIWRTLSDLCCDFLDSDETAVSMAFPNKYSERVVRTSGWSPRGEIPLWVSYTGEPVTDAGLPTGCHRLDTFSEIEEDVWSCGRREDRLGFDKNAAYLNWRYFGHPRFDYESYRIDGARARAVLVLKVFRMDAEEVRLHICDLFCSRADEDLSKLVFFLVRARAAAVKASMVTTWLSTTDELAPMLSVAGFSYSPITSREYYLRSSSAVTRAHFDTWNIRMGDSDVY